MYLTCRGRLSVVQQKAVRYSIDVYFNINNDLPVKEGSLNIDQK